MARYNQDWEDLGRNIQDIIDRAVSSQDYQKLNQTIRQTVERAVDAGGEAVRRVARDSRTRTAAAPRKPVKQAEAVVEKKNLPALYSNTNGKTAGGILQIVGGGILSFFTLMGSLAVAFVEAVTGGLAGMSLGWTPLVLLAAGGGLIFNGIRVLTRLGRFKSYKKLLGDKTHCALEKLARGVGKPLKFVKKELRGMIDQGLFLEGHLDKEETMLITSDETYRYFEHSRLQLEQRQQQEARAKAQAQQAVAARDPGVQEVLDRGDAFVAEIRRCNDAIPGEEISAKIDRMELIVARIFDRAEAHPEIVPDLKKLMDYYLPMTVKLLNAYADMDAQPVQGETIQASKREIEDTLDTLNLAFEKLLDSVFQDTALDVSSDISVLQTLLAQEGLTEDELTKMKKNH
ncbi:MAG: 5-bromo-4-chloroindolyl phosphate hydrolysis family protein [Oscillospiraceae bacterium]|nr:5-bromo-4-chloroindolyl phosphate hydrolysis family protein [Oscillospiraceae bacterium]